MDRNNDHALMRAALEFQAEVLKRLPPHDAVEASRTIASLLVYAMQQSDIESENTTGEKDDVEEVLVCTSWSPHSGRGVGNGE